MPRQQTFLKITSTGDLDLGTKGLTQRKTHVKHESSIANNSKVMANVTIFFPTNRKGKQKTIWP